MAMTKLADRRIFDDSSNLRWDLYDSPNARKGYYRFSAHAHKIVTKAKRPGIVAHFGAHSLEDLEAKVISYEQKLAQDKFLKEAQKIVDRSARNVDTTLKPGDVLVSSWGYEGLSILATEEELVDLAKSILFRLARPENWSELFKDGAA
jgi:hypothetical protein